MASNSKRKRNVLNIETKLEILNRLAKKESGASLAQFYNVGKSTISEIKENREAILNFASKLDLEDCSKTRKTSVEEEGYSRDDVYNVDETGVNWKDLPRKSLTSKRESTTPGFKVSKERVTTMVCANAGGTYSLPLLLIELRFDFWQVSESEDLSTTLYKATRRLLATDLIIWSHSRDEDDTLASIPSPNFYTKPTGGLGAMTDLTYLSHSTWQVSVALGLKQQLDFWAGESIDIPNSSKLERFKVTRNYPRNVTPYFKLERGSQEILPPKWNWFLSPQPPDWLGEMIPLEWW
ncbi:hypothetical protein TNCV_131201 [Trichonephila clavipes]|nr:hypothetical protein TNCV_131201 [Trichonephila clavipes]